MKSLLAKYVSDAPVFAILLAGLGLSVSAAGQQRRPLLPASPQSAGVAAASSSTSPTVVLNDASIVQSATNRVGLNIGAIDYWDSGQLLKNLVGTINPSFEPLLDQQIWLLTGAGTTTTFNEPDPYDSVQPNYWQGADYTVVQSSGAELGCAGKVSSNTGGSSPQFTLGTACAAPLQAGDLVTIGKTFSPTPETWWEQNQAGISASLSGGGKLLSDTTDLCATCGTQSLELDAEASGSSAAADFYFDAQSNADIFVLMNGSYQISFWAKAASGSPSLSVSAVRLSSGGYSCGTYSPALSASWTLYTYTCSASETAAKTNPGTQKLELSASSGAVYLDNVSFQRVETGSNQTVFRDEVIDALKSYYSLSSGGNGGTFRDWLGQNGENISNWTQPDYAQMPTAEGTGYFMEPSQSGQRSLSLPDYLAICQAIGAQPYLEVPVTITASDAANLIEYLAGPSSSTYGARRAALGQSEPWTTAFSQIHLSFCNECWNSVTGGLNIPWRSGEPNSEFYYDYSARAKTVFAAMRASSYYNSNSLDLVMNMQTAVTYSADTAIQRAHPDSVELEDYTYGNVNSFATDSALWGAAMVEPYDKVVDPNDPSNFYQSAKDYLGQNACGASGSEPCKVNIYEWGQGTVSGSIDQTHLDYINAGAGEGVIAALEPLLNMRTFGITHQTYFEFAQYSTLNNGKSVKLWGNVVDVGGATNNARPQFLALSLVNQSIIGPMFDCSISNNAEYNFPGNSQNGTSVPPGIPALADVPYLYSFCFENGQNRSIVLINTDLVGSHTVSLSGSTLPSGSVTVRQYAPPSLDSMNEAPTGSASNRTPASVALASSTVASLGSIALPPYSVTALDYATTGGGGGGSSSAATPVLSLAGGSYSGPQTVSISDATDGASIYYTTDGTTPTTSSTKYAGSVAISSTTTLEAIAAATGLLNSAPVSATYSIGAAEPVNYGSGFESAAGLALNGASIDGTALQLTNGAAFEASSAWVASPVPVQSFATEFTFQLLDAQADGFTFALQGSGPSAVGDFGGGLGYQTIPKSFALKFDLHNNAGEGDDSIGTYTGGAAPTLPAIDLTPTGIDLHSGDVMDAQLSYNGSVLTVTLTDTATQASATETFTVDIPAAVGGDTAFAGFTAGTGDLSSTQQILTWTYTEE